MTSNSCVGILIIRFFNNPEYICLLTKVNQKVTSRTITQQPSLPFLYPNLQINIITSLKNGYSSLAMRKRLFNYWTYQQDQHVKRSMIVNMDLVLER